MKKAIVICGLLALAMMLGPWEAQARRQMVIRVGPTWDVYAANAFSRGMDRAAANRMLYRQYRDTQERYNQELINRGIDPMKIKNYREWRKNQ